MSDPYAKPNKPDDELPILDELSRHIPPQQMAILVALLNWALTWTKLVEGKAELTADHAHTMKMVFRGVGPNPHAWAAAAGRLIPLIMNEVQQWEADEAYRKANSMVWNIIKVAAPELANLGKTYDSGVEVRKILARRYAAGEEVDVPSVSEITKLVEERVARRQDANNLQLTSGNTQRPPT